MQTTLCGAFRTRAEAAWRLIRRGQARGVRIAEETLTNLLLLELSSVAPPGFRIRAYSRGDERQIGADLEFWLGQGRQWVGFRIQPKAIDLAGHSYPQLHFMPKQARLHQTDQLIVSALKSYPSTIPLYLLYTGTDAGLLTKHWPCGSMPRRTAQYGCSLVSAFQVYLLRRAGAKRALKDVLPHMRPLQCLVCCTRQATGNFAANALEYFRWSIASADALARPQFEALLTEDGGLAVGPASGISDRYFAPRLWDEPPQYARSLLIEQAVELPEALGGVLVVEARETAA